MLEKTWVADKGSCPKSWHRKCYGRIAAPGWYNLCIPRGVRFPLKKQFPIGAFACVLAFLVLSERPAHAYTDPGSGMLIWQGLVAAFIGAGFYFRKIVFKLFGKKPEKQE